MTLVFTGFDELSILKNVLSIYYSLLFFISQTFGFPAMLVTFNECNFRI